MHTMINYNAKAQWHRDEAQGFLRLARHWAERPLWLDDWERDTHDHFIQMVAIHHKAARQMDKRAKKVEEIGAGLFGLVLWAAMFGSLWALGFML